MEMTCNYLLPGAPIQPQFSSGLSAQSSSIPVTSLKPATSLKLPPDPASSHEVLLNPPSSSEVLPLQSAWMFSWILLPTPWMSSQILFHSPLLGCPAGSHSFSLGCPAGSNLSVLSGAFGVSLAVPRGSVSADLSCSLLPPHHLFPLRSHQPSLLLLPHPSQSSPTLSGLTRTTPSWRI